LKIYDKPSSNELEYLIILEARFKKVKKDLVKYKKKAKLKEFQLKSFDNFINE